MMMQRRRLRLLLARRRWPLLLQAQRVTPLYRQLRIVLPRYFLYVLRLCLRRFLPRLALLNDAAIAWRCGYPDRIISRMFSLTISRLLPNFNGMLFTSSG
jgi:hypothetical protein